MENRGARPDLNTLFNSDIIRNVSPPPDPKLFRTVSRPTGSSPAGGLGYLDGMDSTPEGQKEMMRLGSLLGFEYIVMENFWRSWSEAQLKDVVSYGLCPWVKTFVWSIRSTFQDPKAFRTLSH